ncbi:type I restriction-modification enzyme R subunit C-terminal domain-containing protein, partial [Nocardia farcinica]|uniref:type I restriction-modification enzyme R subunit C-terminal domain-containing protein n=1 Tax=Nocardia farcinica TaxID=37329 RepID=UPI002453E8E2
MRVGRFFIARPLRAVDFPGSRSCPVFSRPTRTATASQIDFVNLVIGHLTRHGEMDPKLLFEPPFTDAAPQGPTQLFAPEQTKRLLGVIRSINESVGASA